MKMLVEEFKTNLIEDGKSNNTVQSYVGDMGAEFDGSLKKFYITSYKNYCDIKLKNIDFLMSEIEMVGKWGKIREVPLKHEVVEAMKEYLVERSTSSFAGSEYLIVGQRGVLQKNTFKTLLENLTA